jgi:hypothetical protein
MNNSWTVKNGGWLNGVGGWVVRRGYGVGCRIDNENLKAKVKVILYYITLLLKCSKLIRSQVQKLIMKVTSL